MFHSKREILIFSISLPQYTYDYRVLFMKSILGAFVKLRKATIKFITSDCRSDRPSVRLSAWQQLSSRPMDFHEI
jgi:hypothetical protein